MFSSFLRIKSLGSPHICLADVKKDWFCFLVLREVVVDDVDVDDDAVVVCLGCKVWLKLGLQLKKVFYVFNNYKSQNEGLISVDRSN